MVSILFFFTISILNHFYLFAVQWKLLVNQINREVQTVKASILLFTRNKFDKYINIASVSFSWFIRLVFLFFRIELIEMQKKWSAMKRIRVTESDIEANKLFCFVFAGFVSGLDNIRFPLTRRTEIYRCCQWKIWVTNCFRFGFPCQNHRKKNYDFTGRNNFSAFLGIFAFGYKPHTLFIPGSMSTFCFE